jgi:hypothetical protein
MNAAISGLSVALPSANVPTVSNTSSPISQVGDQAATFSARNLFSPETRESSAGQSCLAALSISNAFALIVSYGRTMLQTIPNCQIELINEISPSFSGSGFV